MAGGRYGTNGEQEGIPVTRFPIPFSGSDAASWEEYGMPLGS